MMVEQEGTHCADWAIAHSLNAKDTDANADLAFILGRQPPSQRDSKSKGPSIGPPYAVVCLRLFVKTLRPCVWVLREWIMRGKVDTPRVCMDATDTTASGYKFLKRLYFLHP